MGPLSAALKTAAIGKRDLPPESYTNTGYSTEVNDNDQNKYISPGVASSRMEVNKIRNGVNDTESNDTTDINAIVSPGDKIEDHKVTKDMAIAPKLGVSIGRILGLQLLVMFYAEVQM